MASNLLNLDDMRLLQRIETYGDEVLRACYLLCGDLETAHRAAQRVFIAADSTLSYESGKTTELYRLVIAYCPCPSRIRSPRSETDPVARFHALVPLQRKAAVLCLYYGLPANSAAEILDIPLRRLLCNLNAATEAITR